MKHSIEQIISQSDALVCNQLLSLLHFSILNYPERRWMSLSERQYLSPWYIDELSA